MGWPGALMSFTASRRLALFSPPPPICGRPAGQRSLAGRSAAGARVGGNGRRRGSTAPCRCGPSRWRLQIEIPELHIADLLDPPPGIDQQGQRRNPGSARTVSVPGWPREAGRRLVVGNPLGDRARSAPLRARWRIVPGAGPCSRPQAQQDRRVDRARLMGSAPRRRPVGDAIARREVTLDEQSLSAKGWDAYLPPPDEPAQVGRAARQELGGAAAARCWRKATRSVMGVSANIARAVWPVAVEVTVYRECCWGLAGRTRAIMLPIVNVVGCSELVAAGDPVVPVLDGLPRVLVGGLGGP